MQRRDVSGNRTALRQLHPQMPRGPGHKGQEAQVQERTTSLM